MKCLKCSKDNLDGVSFCESCGNPFNNNAVGNRKITNNRKFIIGAIILVILILVVISKLFIGKEKQNNYNNDNNIVDTSNKDDDKTTEVTPLNSLEKIRKDYQDGTIDINEYFTELVYLEYDSSKLSTKYQDSSFVTTDCSLQLNSILLEHYNELDQDIVEYYLKRETLADVSLIADENIQQQKSNNDYEVTFLKNNNNPENIYNHTLNRVLLSNNGKFLIWYADKGSDAISKETAQQIAVGLENSISQYEQLFGIEYSYTPYIDNILFNEDYKNASSVLKANNLDTSILKTAMSVYIYDTGSSNVLATYIDQQDLAKFINNTIILDILDKDGVVNYPYIRINRKAIEENPNNLIQLYNHELFHHMQYLYCSKATGERCTTGHVINETTANYASSLVSENAPVPNFLSIWAGIYTNRTSTKLEDITDSVGTRGYALFPYLYAYGQNVSGGNLKIMQAHTYSNSLEYLHKNTSKRELMQTINYLALHTLSKDYPSNAYKPAEDIIIKKTLNIDNDYVETISAGAINYYELNDNMIVKIDSTLADDYLTYNIYGFNQSTNSYNQIGSQVKNINTDLSKYSSYDKIYLAITNGSLVDNYNCKISILANENKSDNDIDDNDNENQEYNTSFRNYNMNITMKMSMNGINTKSVTEGIVDEYHQKQYLESTITTMGFDVTSKMYVDLKKGITYTTQPYSEDIWLKEKSGSTTIDLGEILKKLKSMKDVKKISSNHYKVKLSTNEIKKLMASSGSSVSTDSVKGSVEVDVYVKNGYITKLEYDFSKLIKGIDNYTAVIEFSNYDKAGDVEIPSDIIDSAKAQS